MGAAEGENSCTLKELAPQSRTCLTCSLSLHDDMRARKKTQGGGELKQKQYVGEKNKNSTQLFESVSFG